jgi:ornithine cyclodeaminase/alanine dehydrogenase-like protein (mu-crystallin family)
MADHPIIYLSRADVEAVALDMPTIIKCLEEAFLEKSRGNVEMPPKPGVHPQPNAFIHAMPAYIPALRSAGLKWVSGFPENKERGLPYISGLIILNDVETGLPYAVMDCTWVTAYRTGAKTAIAAKHLARSDSEVAD